jgi:hypothetical protein
LGELVYLGCLEFVLGAKLHRAQGVFGLVVGKIESRVVGDRPEFRAAVRRVETCPESIVGPAPFEK